MYYGNYGSNMPPYGAGSGGGYVPYMAQAQAQAQQTQQAAQSQMIYANVNGLTGAKAFFVPPNGQALLMDSDNPMFYIKRANAMGQMTIRKFKFDEVFDDDTEQKIAYAKADDLAAVNERLLRLEQAINGAKDESNTRKSKQ